MSSISTDSIKDKMTENVNTYMMNTHYLNDYNEIYNVNQYLDDKNQVEKERLQQMFERLNSTLLRIKYDYMLRRYDIQNYNYKINMISYAVILVCILLILTIMFKDGRIGPRLLFSVVTASIVVFSLIVFLISKSNSYREKTNWDMFYWGPVERK